MEQAENVQVGLLSESDSTYGHTHLCLISEFTLQFDNGRYPFTPLISLPRLSDYIRQTPRVRNGILFLCAAILMVQFVITYIYIILTIHSE